VRENNCVRGQGDFMGKGSLAKWRFGQSGSNPGRGSSLKSEPTLATKTHDLPDVDGGNP